MAGITASCKGVRRWVINNIDLRHWHTISNSQILHNPVQARVITLFYLLSASYSSGKLSSKEVLEKRIHSRNDHHTNRNGITPLIKHGADSPANRTNQANKHRHNQSGVTFIGSNSTIHLTSIALLLKTVRLLASRHLRGLQPRRNHAR